jgi:hypothetical protein
MSYEFDLDGFNTGLQETLARGREAFKGKYQTALNELAGLSKAEINQIMPEITDLQKYDELITVVKEASRVNLAQAELKNNIEKLGDVAVKVAKLVPSLAGIFSI